jgi:hypothetical protein
LRGRGGRGASIGLGSQDREARIGDRRDGIARRRAIRRAVEFAAPVDGIDIEAERVLAQNVGLLRGLSATESIAVQRVLPARLPRS